MKQPYTIGRRLRHTPSKHGHQVLIRVRGLTKSPIEIPVRDYVGNSYILLSVKKKHWKSGFIAGGKYHKSPRDVNTLLQLVEYDVENAIKTLLSENVKITYDNVLSLTYAHKEKDIIDEERIKKGEILVREDGGAFENEDDFLEFLERQDDPKFIQLKRKAGLLKRQYLMDYWEDYINDCGVKSHELIQSSLLRHIERDDANIHAVNLDDEWLKQYFISTIKSGYKGKKDGKVVTKHYEISTIEKYLKILRSYGDYLFEEGVLDNQNYRRFKLRNKKKGQSILKYNADPFKNAHALIKKEFDHLFGFKFADESLDRIRDVFILQVWLGGLRKKDFFSLSDSNFTTDSDDNIRVWFSQKKTMEDVMNPINRSYLEPIFTKYGNSLPNFPTPSKYNKKLKKVFEAAGLSRKLPFKYEYAKDDTPTVVWKEICKEVSNSWARNCAVSILCEEGHPDNHIKEFTGHRDEKMLQHYRSIHKTVVMDMLDKTTPSVAYNSIEK